MIDRVSTMTSQWTILSFNGIF